MDDCLEVPKNDPKSIGICPGAKVSHLGITKASKKPNINKKKQETPTNHQTKLPVLGYSQRFNKKSCQELECYEPLTIDNRLIK